MSDLKRIMLAGEGGQGVQSVALILSEAAYKAGKQVMYIPNFGVERAAAFPLPSCRSPPK